jgi:MoxR-like ATPase
VTRENLLEERARAAAVFCDERIKRAVVEIARATRGDERVRYGASPRGALHLLDAARARAHLAGRDYVNESDLERLSVPVLAHRVRSKEPEVTGEMIVTEYTEKVVSRMRHDDGVPA